MTTLPFELPGLTPEQLRLMFSTNTFSYEPCMLARVGSDSHGTKIQKDDPESIDDTDLMAVYVGPIEAYLGFGRQETVERKFGEWGVYDYVGYDLRHFVGLLAKGNPNVLGMLWMPEKHIIHMNGVGRELRENRALFATKQAHVAFNGYAKGQLHRMTHFDGPVREKMRRIEEELKRRGVPLDAKPEQYTRPEDMKTWPNGGPYTTPPTNQLVQAYREMAAKYTSGYMGQKRRELVEKHGYDVKNAAHLIRLLKMGIEFLRDGELRVDRTGIDAEELMEIKRGEWSLARVQAYADQLFQQAGEGLRASTLPERPDRERIEAVLVSLLRRWFDGDRTLHSVA